MWITIGTEDSLHKTGIMETYQQNLDKIIVFD